jgi:hypothetical protein
VGKHLPFYINAYQNKVSGKIFEPKEEEITGRW